MAIKLLPLDVGLPAAGREGADLLEYGAGLQPGARSPAAYAASGMASRGRLHAEPECTTRSPSQRDRDRILHASPFRRLTHKTQVFIFHEGDHYRTRLTHSLEVAQIARTIARQLRLDEDLAEALALAHDLGHPPFGHAGERALDRVMASHGGFDHNAQSLRIVTRLERKYLDFDGLNLTWETLEGLAKHNGPLGRETDAVHKVVARLGAADDLMPQAYASGEAQVAALADDIAYVCHDIDDALRAGLLSLDALSQAPLTAEIIAGVRRVSRSDDARVIYESVRRMITLLIADMVSQSRHNLMALAPCSADDIRLAPQGVIAFSGAMRGSLVELKAFLFAQVYRHERVMRVMRQAEGVVCDLFQRCLEDASAMPSGWREAAASLEGRKRARLVADYVAGMTDRYALAAHRALFDATPELR